MIIETKKLSDLKPAPYNPRKSTEKQEAQLKNSLEKFGVVEPIIFNKQTGYIVGGHFRVRELKKLGYKEVECVIVDLSEDDERELNIRLNANTGEWDWEELANAWDSEKLEEWGLDLPGFDDAEDVSEENINPKKLSDRFIIPPFSVLDTKQGDWQQRKNYWLSLGIKSELGRDAKSNAQSSTFKGSQQSKNDLLNEGTSIFDPVLCELSYQWFNVPKGKILDPFAGGSVRGIVASKLGFEYLGNDLRQEQIEANRINAKEVLMDSEIYPVWTSGDSLNIDKIAKGYEADMIFSCPPYADLEVYSDLKEDISNMPYKEFISIYREIIRKSCEMLKQDRFAVFVVGDVRDKKGFYQNFVSDTIKSFVDCGVLLYNEMILSTPVGTVAMQTSRNFPIGRKVGKSHQNVLVFYKGDPKKIKSNYTEIDLSYLENNSEDM
jgi:DNA modification methylase